MNNFYKKYRPFIDIMTRYCEGYDEETGGSNYRLHHQTRVARNAYIILQSYPNKKVREKIVVIGGLFHDIGRIYLLKSNNKKTLRFANQELQSQKGHEDLSKQVIQELLHELLNVEDVNQVCEAINRPKQHQKRTLENKFLYDADFLDELGTLNIFRMFTYSGIMNRSLPDTIKYWFYVDRKSKLDKLNKCFTDFAKKEGMRRILLQDKIMHELNSSGFNNS